MAPYIKGDAARLVSSVATAMRTEVLENDTEMRGKLDASEGEIINRLDTFFAELVNKDPAFLNNDKNYKEYINMAIDAKLKDVPVLYKIAYGKQLSVGQMLHEAATRGQAQVVQELLACGLSAEEVDQVGGV